MKKFLALGALSVLCVAVVGCSSDDDNGIGGLINGQRCESAPGVAEDYIGTACEAGDEGRYTAFAHNVNGVNTKSCVDEADVPQSTEEFDQEYVTNGPPTLGSTLGRDGEFIKGDDCASGKVSASPSNGDPAQTRTYVWTRR